MSNPLIIFLLSLNLFFSSASANAQVIEHTLNENTRLEKLSEELRCLVCQNQSLAESNAPLAKDLKLQIGLMMDRGMSDQEITDYLVNRYGDFILYKPPLNEKTALLWIMPFTMLIIGFTTLLLTLRKRAHISKGKTKNAI